MTKNDIIKKILMHRSRVSIKLSTIGNDIAARGRRHDNSYTGETEMSLINKIISEPDKKEKYTELLSAIHSKNNDYCPEYHGGINEMDMIQLLEYIADEIVKVDERGDSFSTNEYVDKVLLSITSKYQISDDLNSIISNTVLYFLDRNKTILKNLEKQGTNISSFVEGGSINGEK